MGSGNRQVEFDPTVGLKRRELGRCSIRCLAQQVYNMIRRDGVALTASGERVFPERLTVVTYVVDRVIPAVIRADKSSAKPVAADQVHRAGFFR